MSSVASNETGNSCTEEWGGAGLGLAGLFIEGTGGAESQRQRQKQGKVKGVRERRLEDDAIRAA